MQMVLNGAAPIKRLAIGRDKNEPANGTTLAIWFVRVGTEIRSHLKPMKLPKKTSGDATQSHKKNAATIVNTLMLFADPYAVKKTFKQRKSPKIIPGKKAAV